MYELFCLLLFFCAFFFFFRIQMRPFPIEDERVSVDGFVRVFTDGACANNNIKDAPNRAGWGVFWTHTHKGQFGRVSGTQNPQRAELVALEKTINEAIFRKISVEVVSDCTYIGAVYRHLDVHFKHGFQSSPGVPLRDSDVRSRLYILKQRLKELNIKVKIMHVNRAKHTYNILADVLAVMGVNKLEDYCIMEKEGGEPMDVKVWMWRKKGSTYLKIKGTDFESVYSTHLELVQMSDNRQTWTCLGEDGMRLSFSLSFENSHTASLYHAKFFSSCQ